VHIDSLGVSRHHAAIRWMGDRYVVLDMASRNGTFVNRSRIRESPLCNGDAIGVGDCQIRFLNTMSALADEDALKLVAVAGDPVELEAARQRSDWASFFRHGRAARQSEAHSDAGVEWRI
jgi:pSer/pThr/pTyr-binding forkhead associated (FHA) protein